MTFKFQSLLTVLAAAGATTLMAAPSRAATFMPFVFSTEWSGNPPDGDVLLNSVSYDDTVVTDFELVTGAEILFNEEYTGGDTGALSSDRGPDTPDDSLVGQGPAVEDPTDADVVASLANLNLNSILDTEDTGTASLLVSFDAPLSRFLFWERGINSELLVEALDDEGNVIADYMITPDMVTEAGFSIRTTETVPNLDGEDIQPVGSLGLKLEDDAVEVLRLSSMAGFNGPDYKVLGVEEAPKDIPEPAAPIGLGLVVGAAALKLRRRG